MNVLSFTLEKIEFGSTFDQSDQPLSKTIVHIIVKSTSYSEITAKYAFSQEQLEELNELISDKYGDVWEELLNSRKTTKS